MPLLRRHRRVGFNPRLRTGGDRIGAPGASTTSRGFNPRLRTGGDGLPGLLGALDELVSIRASAREATVRCVRPPLHGLVSIRASAREATPADRRVQQPTGVSIRASAREATAGRV